MKNKTKQNIVLLLRFLSSSAWFSICYFIINVLQIQITETMKNIYFTCKIKLLKTVSMNRHASKRLTPCEQLMLLVHAHKEQLFNQSLSQLNLNIIKAIPAGADLTFHSIQDLRITRSHAYYALGQRFHENLAAVKLVNIVYRTVPIYILHYKQCISKI